MKLWHDDVRRAPEGWEWARTNAEAKQLLSENDVEEISLDHDLGGHKIDPDHPAAIYFKGSDEDDGKKLVAWMIENDLVPPKVEIHSWNPAGRDEMAAMLNDAGYDCHVLPFSAERYEREKHYYGL
jgi:hypothetical protein